MCWLHVYHVCYLAQELIKFAYDEKIVLMADEVYQENIYQDERPFVSARKVRNTRMQQLGEQPARQEGSSWGVRCVMLVFSGREVVVCTAESAVWRYCSW